MLARMESFVSSNRKGMVLAGVMASSCSIQSPSFAHVIDHVARNLDVDGGGGKYATIGLPVPCRAHIRVQSCNRTLPT